MSDGGSSSLMTPRAGDATQGAKDGELGTLSDSPPPKTATRMESPMKKLALALLHARDENLYPRLPRFVRRWIYTRTAA